MARIASRPSATASQFVPYSDAARRPTSAITLAEDAGSTRPERHFPSGAVQTRVVSVARIRLHPRKFVRPFKGIICGDISGGPLHHHYQGGERAEECAPVRRLHARAELEIFGWRRNSAFEFQSPDGPKLIPNGGLVTLPVAAHALCGCHGPIP
jgi:hypothetical protein